MEGNLYIRRLYFPHLVINLKDANLLGQKKWQIYFIWVHRINLKKIKT